MVTIYAGSLHDPAAFSPQAAIFTSQRPRWATLALELVEHAAFPDG
jgi:hypothetical protein